MISFQDCFPSLKLSSSKVDELLKLYPQSFTQELQDRTCTSNSLTSQCKRLASIAGDLFFKAHRKLMLKSTSDVPSDTYLVKELSEVPFLQLFMQIIGIRDF